MGRKAVFLANRNHNSIQQVYNDDMMRQLNELVDLHPDIIDRGLLEEHRDLLREAEIAFSTWGMFELTPDEIGRYLPNLKAVFYAAGSVQYFARPFLDRQIMVVSAWAANSIPVAEYTVAQILLANKGILPTLSRCKHDRGEADRFAQNYPGNYGTKVGILGMGMIGSKVVELLRPYQLEVYVYDPFLTEERAKAAGVRQTDLETIFAECQTISNHLANNPQTVGILNKAHFGRMQPYATFINTGRGAQVAEQDLIRAMREVPTRTALLDVTYPEPPLPDSELLTLDNVWLTPHVAGSQQREVVRMAEFMVEECRHYLAGETVNYQVTPAMLATMA
ncbi:hydroxyacid dehydrogenase [Cohnella zeiphila]|uniref:Hydroxyacid dehydrogenase n=1 Tax=Cohnella zeiphila TaxID=2761120 RepID=A0A7X0SQC2_9BACL|nr:hydroxyacid dehydrogenase [Cohnella zeiphila]MBB6734207.1 hydroxyacid dehydrogenase [Cohnella zeiphila]